MRDASCEIREAREDDAAALLDFFRRIGAESTHLTFGAEGVGLREEEERAHLARMRDAERSVMLVAEIDGAIVGALAFVGGTKPRTRHVGELGVGVARAHWGRGIGRTLIEAMLAWAIDGRVIRKVNLRVRVDNERAIALYERLGFRVEGRVTRSALIDGRFHDSLLMGLAIDPSSVEA